MVEYIMLVAVLASLTFSIINSSAFKNLLGENSDFFTQTKEYIQFSYQHGRPKGNSDRPNRRISGQEHATYYEKSDTHFFLPFERYPE
jgi:hypothetical protein